MPTLREMIKLQGYLVHRQGHGIWQNAPGYFCRGPDIQYFNGTVVSDQPFEFADADFLDSWHFEDFAGTLGAVEGRNISTILSILATLACSMALCDLHFFQ